MNPDAQRISVFDTLKGSRFFIPCILMGTYLIFTVIPSMIVSIWHIKSPNSSYFKAIVTFYRSSEKLSQTVDSIIYIFLQRPVRQLLLQQLWCQSGSIECCISNAQDTQSGHYQRTTMSPKTFQKSVFYWTYRLGREWKKKVFGCSEKRLKERHKKERQKCKM